MCVIRIAYAPREFQRNKTKNKKALGAQVPSNMVSFESPYVGKTGTSGLELVYQGRYREISLGYLATDLIIY